MSDVEELRALLRGRSFSSTGGRRRGGDPEYVRRVRPLRPGYSFGLARQVGTLGLVVAPEEGPARPLLLSSSHVLNHRSDGVVYRLYQPAGCDRPPGSRPVARSLRFTRLHPSRVNRTEGGLAEPYEPGLVEPAHPLGRLRGVARELTVGQRLRKVARTTGEVSGKIRALDWSGRVGFRGGSRRFSGQLLIETEDGLPISLDGDSGAVWLTEDNQVAALAFAGSDDGLLSISTPIERVFRALRVRLWPEDEETSS